MQSEKLHKSSQAAWLRKQRGTSQVATTALIWTTVLAMIALEIYTMDPWLVLAIPGAILMGYGLRASKHTKIALQKRTGSTLN
jgi:hypothetical protein